jgi:hypothetical protein
MDVRQKVSGKDVGGNVNTEPAELGQPRQRAATDQFPRRPDSDLDTCTAPTRDGVRIAARPINDIVVAQRVAGVVSEVVAKLDAHAAATGARVGPSSVREKSTGPIPWLLTSNDIVDLVRGTVPVEAYDLTRLAPDGTTADVCQVRIAKGFFSGRLKVAVVPYPGGKTEGDRVEIALGLKRAPSEGAAGSGQHNHTTHNSSAKPTGASITAVSNFEQALGAETPQQDPVEEVKRIALTSARKMLGLKSNASESDIQEMRRLVAVVEKDLKVLLNDPASRLDATQQSDGTYTVLCKSYTIEHPEALQGLESATWLETFTVAGILISTGLGAFLGAIPALSGISGGTESICAGVLGIIGFSLGALVSLYGGEIAVDRHINASHLGYLKIPLQGKEPGTLGAIVDSLHKAGYNCNIRVGTWNGKEMRVDLTVSERFTPREAWNRTNQYSLDVGKKGTAPITASRGLAH